MDTSIIVKDKDDLFYKGEPINLDGRTRHIKYTMKGLKCLAEACGGVVEAFSRLQKMNPNFDVETMDNLVLLLHAGLIHEDAALSIDDVENMLSMDNLTPIFSKIIAAFSRSMPQAKDDGGSGDEPGESKA